MRRLDLCLRYHYDFHIKALLNPLLEFSEIFLLFFDKFFLIILLWYEYDIYFLGLNFGLVDR